MMISSPITFIFKATQLERKKTKSIPADGWLRIAVGIRTASRHRNLDSSNYSPLVFCETS